MTVETTNNKSGPYALDGRRDFPRYFMLLDEKHMQVIHSLNGADNIIYGGYTQTGIGENEGSVIFDIGVSLPTEGVLTLYRYIEPRQETDYSNQARVQPVQVEDDLDKLMMLIQQSNEVLSRAILVSKGSTHSIDPIELDGFEEFGNKVLQFNADATKLIAGPDSFDVSEVLASNNAVEARIDEFDDIAESVEGLIERFGPTLESRAKAELANFPAPLMAFSTLGYAAGGDGGGATYKRVGSQPSHAGKVQSADGAWWELSVSEVDVRQFGVIGDGVTNDAANLQSAVNYCQEKQLPLAFAPNSYVRVGNTITIKQGMTSPSGIKYGIRINGRGASIMPAFNGWGFTIESQCPIAEKTSGKGQGVWEIRDLVFDGYHHANAKAIYIGRAGYFGYDYLHSAMRNCKMVNMTAENAVVITGVGMLIFDNCTSELGVGWTIGSTGDGDFTGDTIFENCQMQGSPTQHCLSIFAGPVANLCETRGIHFIRCHIYDGTTEVTAAFKGDVSDIWFVDCGLSCENKPAGVEILGHIYSVNPNGKLYDIVYRGNYIAGWSGTPIRFSGNAGAVMKGVVIEGNMFGYNNASLSIPPTLVYMVNYDGALISNNQLHDNVAESALYFNGSRNFTAVGNRSQGVALTHGIIIGNASENFMVNHNAMWVTGSIVNDFSTGVTKLVDGNLKTTSA